MLSLDALDDPRAQLLLIFGTALATTASEPFYGGKREVMRALRKRFGRQVEYVGLVEFTTGKGKRSGGRRRPHWNLFVKGVEVEDFSEAVSIAIRAWCANVPGAKPEAQYGEPVRDVGAASKYVAMHFHKLDQSPPEGWSGQRFNASRGYFFGRTRREMRALARASLQRERTQWKLLQQVPELSEVVDETFDEIVDELLEQHYARRWTLHKMHPHDAEHLLAGVVDPPVALSRRGP